jgi:flagellar motor switch protein FliG
MNAREIGIRKAAILMASLDRDAADLLLEQLGQECAELVREAALALDELDDAERQRVIDEFRRIGPMVPDKSPPGIELDGLVAPSISGLEEQTMASATEATAPAGQIFMSAAEQAATPAPPPFGFLREAEEEKLCQVLSTERPQTIALVLSHLPPERAGEVLSRFAPALTIEVIRRLADLDSADPETLRQVEQAIEARLSRQFDTQRDHTGGPEAVARILAACDAGVAGGILDNLAQFDEALASQLGRRPLKFDDLVEFDDAMLSAVFQAAEPEVAEVALLSAPPELVERVLRRMVPEEAAALRQKLDSPGPIRLSDVDEAQQRIASLAQRMSRDNPRLAA